MFHTHADLDTYVQEFQRDRQREAAQARRINEATRNEGQAVDPLALGLARFITRTRSWLSILSSGKAAASVSEVALAAPAPYALDEHGTPPASRQTVEPYNGMVVIARGRLEEAAQRH